MFGYEEYEMFCFVLNEYRLKLVFNVWVSYVRPFEKYDLSLKRQIRRFRTLRGRILYNVVKYNIRPIKKKK